MVAAAAWMVLALAIFQVYVGLVLLLARGERRWGRRFLAALFLLNAGSIAFGFLFRDLLGATVPAPMGWLDLLTNGLLVLAVEALTAELGQRRFWVGAVPVALLGVLGGEAWLMQTGSSTWAFILLVYAYASIRLAGALWSNPKGPAGGTAVWLAAAFFPRFLEMTMDGVINAAPGLAELGPLTWACGLLVFGASAVAVASLARGLGHGRNVFAVLFLVSGILLGGVRILSSGAQDDLTVMFTLAVLRPLAVLAATMQGSPGLPSLSWAAVGRHVGLMALGTLTFLASVRVIPFIVPPRSSLVDLVTSFALTAMSLPLWGLAIDRALMGPALPESPVPATLDSGRAERRAPGAEAKVPVRPGLDPACRFSREDLAAYDRARARAGSLATERRATLGALNRRERILLALTASSTATLGDPRFTQAGLQWSTHIPYRYLSTVIRDANKGNRNPLIATSRGLRGLRYYWLTPEGAEEARRLAVRLELRSEPDLRAVLGEAFYRQTLAESTAT